MFKLFYHRFGKNMHENEVKYAINERGMFFFCFFFERYKY